MKIYTRTGDDGGTRCADGTRVPKSDRLLEAVGTLDELNSTVGLCLSAAGGDAEIAAALAPVQAELFGVGGRLGAGEANAASPGDSALRRVERAIDAASAGLAPLRRFVLPGGCELAARLHLARTVCRRAERRVVAAADANVPADVLKYLNRLGDLLFVLARLGNLHAARAETTWDPKSP